MDSQIDKLADWCRRLVFISGIVMSGLLSGCKSGATEVEIVQKGSHAMEDVYVIVGHEKVHWAAILGKRSQSVTLPANSEITIIYDVRGNKRTWQSPIMDKPGRRKLVIHVDTDIEDPARAVQMDISGNDQ